MIGAAGATLSGSGNVTLSHGSINPNLIFGTTQGSILTNQQTIQGTAEIGVFNNLGLNNTGTIDANVAPGMTIQTTRGLINGNSGVLEATNGASLTIDNDPAGMTNTGTIEAAGGMVTLYATVFSNVHGIIEALNSGTVVLDGGAVINGGTLTTTGNGSINVGANSMVTLSGVTLTGNTLLHSASLQGTTTNSGTATVTSVSNSGKFINAGGTVNVQQGGLFAGVRDSHGARTDSYTQTGQSASTVVNSTFSSLTLVQFNGGAVSGTGTVFAPHMTVRDGTVLSPGNGSSLGALTLDGNYFQGGGSALGVFDVAIASTSSYDEFVVNGRAWLRGELDVTLLGNFVPTVGNKFTIFTYKLRSGRFEVLHLPALPNTEHWTCITCLAIFNWSWHRVRGRR